MNNNSPAAGVKLVEVSEAIHKDVKAPNQELYLIECLAYPVPGNAIGATEPIPVFAMVSLSEESLAQVKEAISSEDRFDLESIEQLFIKPDLPLTEKEIDDAIVARKILAFNPRWNPS